jgi:hypothetical protein
MEFHMTDLIMSPDDVASTISNSRGALTHLRIDDKKFVRKSSDEDDGVYFESTPPAIMDFHKAGNSKCIRRLGGKTQVFAADSLSTHARTRASHTAEVTATSSNMAYILGLNADLCMAGAQLHDFGHTPFGHDGEAEVSNILSRNGQRVKFKHNEFGLVVTQEIERKGDGLNLTLPTLLLMKYHTTGGSPLVWDYKPLMEAGVVRIADKICYVTSDFNDLLRLRKIQGKNDTSDIPNEFDMLGSNQRERTNTLVAAVVGESARKGYISFSEGPVYEAFKVCKDWIGEKAKQTDLPFNRAALREIYDTFEKIPEFAGCNRAYLIALLTDREIMNILAGIQSHSINNIYDLRNTGICEIYPYVPHNLQYPYDLSWGSSYFPELINADYNVAIRERYGPKPCKKLD